MINNFIDIYYLLKANLYFLKLISGKTIKYAFFIFFGVKIKLISDKSYDFSSWRNFGFFALYALFHLISALSIFMVIKS